MPEVGSWLVQIEDARELEGDAGTAGSTGTSPADRRELSPSAGGNPAVAGRVSRDEEDAFGQTESRDEYPGGA